MVLNRSTTRVFHRTLYATEMESVILLKRGDDQRQGQVVQYQLFDCRRSKYSKTKEPIQNEMAADERTVWHIPKVELERVGVRYINAADRILQTEGDEAGRYWQPEADTGIDVHIFGNEIHIHCLRIDPPGPSPQGYT